MHDVDIFTGGVKHLPDDSRLHEYGVISGDAGGGRIPLSENAGVGQGAGVTAWKKDREVKTT